METIEIGGILCRVERSARRKRLAIRIGGDGTPELLLPMRMPLSDAIAFAEQHIDWMKTHSAEQTAIAEQSEALSYGGKLRVFGGEWTLVSREGDRVGYAEGCFYVPPGLNADELRGAVVQVYRLLAKNDITARVRYWSGQMGLSPVAVKINSATSHWATCSKKDSLNFTWFCVMAEPEEIDYIVIHELCHMWEFNHSERFWALVEKWCPDYRRHKKNLDALWKIIRSENWK
ncbi:MAG: M48 family metallopeptidase [Clostridia bacterium]|nr:M48 family metallopeptidase [Clostridia bacterium]